MKKYVLTDEKKEFLGKTLHRIQAIRLFGDVKEGEKGGWIEKEENLSHDGDCWVSGDALVFETARVFGNARVFEDAQIFGDARVFGDALVFETARVFGAAKISSSAIVEKAQDFICFSSIGPRVDSATFYKNKDKGISVCCGCFRDTIEEFQKQVAKTHGSNKFAKEYNLAIELAKIHILEEIDE